MEHGVEPATWTLRTSMIVFVVRRRISNSFCTDKTCTLTAKELRPSDELKPASALQPMSYLSELFLPCRALRGPCGAGRERAVVVTTVKTA